MERPDIFETVDQDAQSGSNGVSITTTDAGTSGDQQASTTDRPLQSDVTVDGSFIDSVLQDTQFTRQDVDLLLSAATAALMVATLYASMEGSL